MTLIRKCTSVLTISIFLSISIFILTDTCRSATLYKRYLVVKDRGKDILCEPYTIERNDYVLKLFKQKGELSNKDFPEFLKIFQRINPDVQNINNLSPGEKILIPLKKIGQEAFPNQESGVIDIPFITISTVPDILKKYSKAHTIKSGEVLSKLVAKSYGNYGTHSYKEGIEILKALNPDIENLDRIYPGQKIALPSFSLRNELFYSALFDSHGNIKKDGLIKLNEKPVEPSPPEDKTHFVEGESIFRQTASILNASLHDKGIFFLPQKNKNDLKIDLSKSPLLEKNDGSKILFANQVLSKANIRSLKKYWKNLQVIPLDKNLTFKQIIDSIAVPKKTRKKRNRISFKDDNVQISINSQWIFDSPTESSTSFKTCVSIIENACERTPDVLCNYLKQRNIIIKDVLNTGYIKTFNDKKSGSVHYTGGETFINNRSQKSFVNDFVMALDLYYAPNISISFPYSGIQIKAFANLISTGDGRELLIDFANLYGDAFKAIKKTGFSVISINRKECPNKIINNILAGLKIPYTKDPVFLGAERSSDYNISIRVPGYYIKKSNKQQYLILLSKIDRELMNFVQNRGVDLILIES